MTHELWSARRIAQEYGWAPSTARWFIAKHGLKHKAVEGPRDTHLYDPKEVRVAKARMRGRGHYKHTKTNKEDIDEQRPGVIRFRQ